METPMSQISKLKVMMGSQETNMMPLRDDVTPFENAEEKLKSRACLGIHAVQLAGFPHIPYLHQTSSHLHNFIINFQLAASLFQVFSSHWSNVQQKPSRLNRFPSHQIGDSHPNSHPNLPIAYQRAPHKSRRWTLDWDLESEAMIFLATYDEIAHEAMHGVQIYIYIYVCICIYIYIVIAWGFS